MAISETTSPTFDAPATICWSLPATSCARFAFTRLLHRLPQRKELRDSRGDGL